METAPAPASATPSGTPRGGEFDHFSTTGALGGMVLLACAAAAMVWANSPASQLYHHILELELSVGAAQAPLTMTLHHWINDGLMAVFFLLVGLEIKRELLVGELSDPRQAVLPVAAAFGGMLVPAAAYLVFNWNAAGMRGWGVPMATDIAFALGILALLGRRVPSTLKVFLAAFAIVDDLGAVALIALFYTAAVNTTALAIAAGCVIALIALNRSHVATLTPYLLVGVALWSALLFSGVHSTIAGVLLAFCIPSRTRIDAAQYSARMRELIDEFDHAETGDRLVITSKGQQAALHEVARASGKVNAPLLALEQLLAPIVAFGVMPVFALANAGLPLADVAGALRSPVAVGVIAGLVIGKPLGIIAFARLATWLGAARLPAGVSWSQLTGVAILGGVGFTMSLFIAGLAFADEATATAAKAGVLTASAISGVTGYLVLRTLARRTERSDAPFR